MSLQQKFYREIESWPVNCQFILKTEEDQQPNPVALQILSTPKKRSDHH